ncbi:MAG: VanZ family protein [Clostridiales bacterium]|nr:VanZ family protein [Clostridiales bacterium]MDY5515714.1 VanZ family protein [Candidatus Ventricola sp.]
MKKAAAWALCAAWMALIFFMSAMPGDVSGEQSGTIVDLLLGALETAGVAQEAIDPAMLELLLRKGAHMAEYAVLFVLFFRALRLSGAHHPGLTALLMSAAYAATDEFHQMFSEGRGPSPVDVLIDIAGAGGGWGVLTLLSKRPKALSKKEG